MDDKRNKEPPFPNATRTGRGFISPCCTASVREFLVDGVHYLAGSVAGRGWGEPWLGRIEEINDDSTLVDADGTERRIRWRPVHETAP